MAVKLAIEVADIKWDTDGEAVEGLPSTMAFEIEVGEFDPDAPDYGPEVHEAATERMSSETSWCVESFAFASVREVERTAAPSM